MILPEVTTLAEARVAIRDLAEEVEKLSNELAWFRRQLFGSKTEHYIPRDDTPSLFPEEMSPESPKEVPTAPVAEHERKVRQANALSEIPADLPREERVIDVPEEERLGMVLIGYEESERIAYRTGLYVIHFKRAKYAPGQPLSSMPLQTLFRNAILRIEEIWKRTHNASQENSETNRIRQPAPDGFTGRGGISVIGGAVYRVAAGFERTAGSPTRRDLFCPRRGRLHDGSGNPPK